MQTFLLKLEYDFKHPKLSVALLIIFNTFTRGSQRPVSAHEEDILSIDFEVIEDFFSQRNVYHSCSIVQVLN